MNITVYCGSNTSNDPVFAQSAKELGEWIAKSGNTLVYGGSSVGLMGIVSNTVLENDGRAIGVEPEFFINAGVAQHNLTELYVVETMRERKAKMIELGDVFVALPGGVGTLEEISEVMCRVRLRLTAAPCFFLNIDHFYDPMIDLLDSMDRSGFMPGYEKSDYIFAESVDDLIEAIQSLPCDREAFASEKDWKCPAWMDTETAY